MLGLPKMPDATGNWVSVAPPQTQAPTGGGEMPDLFQPNLFPQSTSQSSSSNSGRSRSQSFSGIDQQFTAPFLTGLFPQLEQAYKGINPAIDQFQQNAGAQASGAGRQLANDTVMNLLDSLNQRGVVNSSVASDTLGRALGDVAQREAGWQYQANQDAARMRMDVPNLLARLAELGRYSSGESTSSSSGGSTSISQNSNPLAPYQMMADFLLQL